MINQQYYTHKLYA